MKQELLQVGKIVGTHGIRGMVRIEPWCDAPEFLTQFRQFRLENGQTLAVQRVQPHGRMALAKLSGVDSIEQAEALRGQVLSVHRDAAALPEGRWFVSDLLGASVFAADGTTPLGVLTDVSQTGANDVWHITRSGREYLVPAIAQVIVSVDIEAGRIVLDPMKGIFDDAD